jgi:hypothetical protein
LQRQPDYDINVHPDDFIQKLWSKEGAGIWEMMSLMDKMFGFAAMSCERGFFEFYKL